MKLRQIRSHIPFRLFYYDVICDQAGYPAKIGQFAVGISPFKRIFADGLHLLPDYRHAWAVCMATALRTLGPGHYVYGSDWSFEPPRERALSQLPGVTISNVEKYMVEAVDFGRWVSWDEYQQSISTNIKRTVKKAKTAFDPLTIDARHDANSISIFPKYYYARYRMLRRKIDRFQSPKLLNFFRFLVPFGYMLRLCLIRRYIVLAILRKNDTVLASFSGAEIGEASYYFDGGSVEANGTGWLLIMSLMHQFYQRHPKGRFVMGCEKRQDDHFEEEWESAVRYRRRTRVSGFPSSRVTFAFSALSPAGR